MGVPGGGCRSVQVGLGAVQGRSSSISQPEPGSFGEMKALQQRGQESSLLQLFALLERRSFRNPVISAYKRGWMWAGSGQF